MTLEDQIKALLEAKEDKKEDDQAKEKEQADRVEDEPAVKVDNPMDPSLGSSEEEPASMMPQTDDEKEEESDEEEKEDEKEEEEDSDDDKKKMQESISDLLGDEFSDEFKLKAATIFEAAVKAQVLEFKAKLEEEHTSKLAKLEEEFEEKFAIRCKQLDEETSDKIDGYLSFLAEEWKKDNAIALEAAIKTELTESFISNLKTLFEQHYVDLPDDKVDLYTQSLQEKAELEKALATSVTTMKQISEELAQVKREQIIEESVKDFTSLDIARFKTLVEDFAYEDEETFKKKISIVKKSFFEQKQSSVKEQLTEDLVNSQEIVEDISPVEVPQENPVMSTYLRALSKKK
jgi:hypothetical protein